MEAVGVMVFVLLLMMLLMSAWGCTRRSTIVCWKTQKKEGEIKSETKRARLVYCTLFRVKKRGCSGCVVGVLPRQQQCRAFLFLFFSGRVAGLQVELWDGAPGRQECGVNQGCRVLGS